MSGIVHRVERRRGISFSGTLQHREFGRLLRLTFPAILYVLCLRHMSLRSRLSPLIELSRDPTSMGNWR
jgi:hypothetical protein